MKELITNAHKGMWVNILAGDHMGNSQVNGTVNRADERHVYVQPVGGDPREVKVEHSKVKLWKSRNTMLNLKPAQVAPAPVTPIAKRREPAASVIAPALTVPVHPPTEAVEVARKMDAHDAKEAAEGIPLEELFPALARAKQDVEAAAELLRESQAMKDEATVRLTAIRDRIKLLVD